MPAPDTMPDDEVKSVLRDRAKLVDDYLADYQRQIPGIPDRLAEAMLYSLRAGGKRVRPVLCLSFATLLGMDMRQIMPFAAALEMIHTYSLIHDDLPAMDNDNLRRGKPSNHVVFGEATAILAGDGLLTDAFYMCSRMAFPADRVLAAIAQLALAAGSSCMVGGQELDMIYTGKKDVSFEEIAHMQALKTGAILCASCVCGAILAGADDAFQKKAGAYGLSLGKAFQITDDILDVTGDSATLGKPVGSDEAAGKNTYPSLLGLEASLRCAHHEAGRAALCMDMAGREAAFLRGLAHYVGKRADWND